MARLVSAITAATFLISNTVATDSFTFGLEKKYSETGESKHLGQA
jgi:hypothetical protein